MTLPLQAVADSATDQNFRQIAQQFPVSGANLARTVLEVISGNLKLEFGAAELTWPGASEVSTALEITHKLGKEAKYVFALPRATGTSSRVGVQYEVPSATKVKFQGYFFTASPSAGTKTPFSWLVVG